MKIVLVNTLYPPSTVGGAERSVALLARAAAARGHDVHVACLHPGDDPLVEADGAVTTHRLPLRNIYWPFDMENRPSLIARTRWHALDQRNESATRELAALIERIDPDVLHTNNLLGFSTEIWAWARERGIRIVHTLRDYNLLCARATLFRNGSDCQSRCVECRFLTRRKKANSTLVDTVASNSRYVIDAHQRFGYFGDTPASVIYNIADTTGEPANGGAASETVTFGFIGRVEPEKGIEVVLDAFRRTARPNWRLRIAGAGQRDYVERLTLANPDPRIEWVGFTPADAFYASVDVVIISSIWPEPLPRTMIECLARGKPTLYSDAGGTPEIGHLAPRSRMYAKDDAAALAVQIDAVLASPAAWQVAAPVDRELLTAFSEEAVVSAYLDLYRQSA